MQNKDITDLDVLRYMRDAPEEPGHGDRFTWSNWLGPGYIRSVKIGMPAGTPDKVALAKMNKLIKRGFVDGCGCGCRGDFTITAAGLDLVRSAEVSLNA